MVSLKNMPFQAVAMLIVIVVLLLVLSLVGFGVSLSNRIVNVHTLWNEYHQDATAASNALQRLQSHLGYGGFIHNFKNYVLRGDAVDIESAKYDIKAALLAIRDYERLELSEAEMEALHQLRRVLAEYSSKVILAESEYVLAMNSWDLDRKVDVDDEPALKAIAVLSEAALARSHAKQAETTQTLERIQGFLVWGALLVPFVLLLGVLLVILLRRLVQANQQVEQSRKDLENIFLGAPDAMLSVGIDGTILEGNQEAERLFGYAADELKGLSVEALIPNELRKAHRRERDGFFAAGNSLRMGMGGVLYGLHKDGHRIPLDISLSTISRGDGRIAVANIRDISDRVRAEEAERLSRAKSEFLSHMSHELRTPLNAILGFSQLLQTNQDNMTEDQKVQLDYILKAGWGLLDLVNDVLDFSASSQEMLAINVEPLALAPVLDEAIGLVMARAAEDEITIHHADAMHLFHVMADRKRLKQVLLNLLTNAVKYNRKGGHINVAVSLLPNNDRVRIDVRDSGLGIEADKLSRIFDPFDRLGHEASTKAGMGIGMALSKQLVERMQGSIRVESKVGIGSVFSVELPIAEAKRNRLPLSVAEPEEPTVDFVCTRNNNHICRILYIEDDQLNVQLMKSLLGEWENVHLYTAMDGSSGIEQAKSVRPDLILLDIRLPDMSGFDVYAHLQQDRNARHIPVIALSASAYADDVAAGMAAGFYAYLSKPVDRVELLRTIEFVMGSKQDAGLQKAENA